MDFETANCKSDKDSLLKLSLFILRVKIGWEKKIFQLIFRSGIILGSKKGLGFSIPIEVCHAPCGAEKIMMRWASFDKASLFKMKVFLIRCLRRAERTMTVKMKRQRFIKCYYKRKPWMNKFWLLVQLFQFKRKKLLVDLTNRKKSPWRAQKTQINLVWLE